MQAKGQTHMPKQGSPQPLFISPRQVIVDLILIMLGSVLCARPAPQADVAIDLSILVQSDQALAATAIVTTPVVLVVARFAGVLHTGRILVPIVTRKHLAVIRSLIRSRCNAGRHQVTLQKAKALLHPKRALLWSPAPPP
jgi:hypothetical protein